MQSKHFELDIQGVPVRLAALHRPGTKPPLVSLHGFGSTKEDYADLALRDDFADRELIFWDAPGCGASEVANPSALSIPFLVDVTLAALNALGIHRFHLSGHSMGGLTALMLAHENPGRVLSFFDIEGNVAPEDCFLSRQIVEHPAATPEAFRDDFATRVRQRLELGSALYAAALPLKVQASTFAPIFNSMVEISDAQPLLAWMERLKCPRAFVHGEQNRHLSYLGRLPDRGVEVIEIAHSGHFPMYTNPPALWSALAGFLTRAESL